MIHQIFVIHDITSETHTQPFYAVNDQVAIRSASNLVQNPGTTFYDNPEDFRLYHIGTFDDETAIINQTPKRQVCRLSDLMVKKFNEDPANEN